MIQSIWGCGIINEHEEVFRYEKNVIHPMYDVSSTEDTIWTSNRYITVTNGQRYEVQLIIGQLRDVDSMSSPLYMQSGELYEGTVDSAGSAFQVVVKDIVTASISNYDPVLGSTVAALFSIQDIWESLDPGLVVSKNASHAFSVSMVTTMKYAFVKHEGALDDGNQVLCYVGNKVHYTVSVLVPILIEDEKGEIITDSKPAKVSDTITSHGFETTTIHDYCIWIAAQNFWKYKNGQSSFMEVRHEVQVIPYEILNKEYKLSVPIGFPVLE